MESSMKFDSYHTLADFSDSLLLSNIAKEITEDTTPPSNTTSTHTAPNTQDEEDEDEEVTMSSLFCDDYNQTIPISQCVNNKVSHSLQEMMKDCTALQLKTQKDLSSNASEGGACSYSIEVNADEPMGNVTQQLEQLGDRLQAQNDYLKNLIAQSIMLNNSFHAQQTMTSHDNNSTANQGDSMHNDCAFFDNSAKSALALRGSMMMPTRSFEQHSQSFLLPQFQGTGTSPTMMHSSLDTLGTQPTEMQQKSQEQQQALLERYTNNKGSSASSRASRKTSRPSSSYARNADESFPAKLYKILSEAEEKDYDHIISFSGDGRCFRVHDRPRFVREIMPLYFKQSSFASFHRQLNCYGFECVHNGRDQTAFFHSLFRRGMRLQSITIPRKKQRRFKRYN